MRNFWALYRAVRVGDFRVPLGRQADLSNFLLMTTATDSLRQVPFVWLTEYIAGGCRWETAGLVDSEWIIDCVGWLIIGLPPFGLAVCVFCCVQGRGPSNTLWNIVDYVVKRRPSKLDLPTMGLVIEKLMGSAYQTGFWTYCLSPWGLTVGHPLSSIEALTESWEHFYGKIFSELLRCCCVWPFIIAIIVSELFYSG